MKLTASTVLAGISGSLLDRLQSVLIAAARRLVFSARKLEHVTPFLRWKSWKESSSVSVFLCTVVCKAPRRRTLVRHSPTDFRHVYTSSSSACRDANYGRPVGQHSATERFLWLLLVPGILFPLRWKLFHHWRHSGAILNGTVWPDFLWVPYILAYKSQNLGQNLAPKVRGAT